MGSPTVYRDKPATWKYGKLLASYNGVSFTYDGQGRRIGKNGISYTYDAEGNLITSSDGLEFIYDNTGVLGVKYNEQQYFYRKDVQGNIIALLDEAGNVVVKYVYDAWGNHEVLDAEGHDIEDNNHIGNLNPFRYRSYYFDTETGFYYLQTRYYDPKVGRFISQDSIEYADPQTINGLNLYAYCLNNPVMYIDPNGQAVVSIIIGLIAGVIIGAAIGGAVAGVKAYNNGARGGKLLGWTLLGIFGGAIIGGAIGAGIGYFAPVIGAFLGTSFTLGSFATGSGAAVAVSVTGAQIAVGAAAAVAGVVILAAYTRKPAGPRIHSNSKKKAYDKAFIKGGKKPPIYHPNGEFGPHYHPNNSKFGHWHYYFSLLFGLFGFRSDDN